MKGLLRVCGLCSAPHSLPPPPVVVLRRRQLVLALLPPPTRPVVPIPSPHPRPPPRLWRAVPHLRLPPDRLSALSFNRRSRPSAASPRENRRRPKGMACLSPGPWHVSGRSRVLRWLLGFPPLREAGASQATVLSSGACGEDVYRSHGPSWESW